MRIIYKIAKTELQILFYSPIAWLLLLCFVIQTALYVSGVYEHFVQEMVGYGNTYRCTDNLFIRGYGGQGLWLMVQNFLYLYIPLLTMGVVSKEFSSGSVKLLYSSPISNTQIILGKFLAMIFFAGILMGVLLCYVVFAACTIKDFELAWVLTGLLGLFLLTCTYMAVGIFVSSLTTYQIIAAVGTFVILMLLSMVSGWGQEYDIIREITYWFGINGRAATFIFGMICSEDLLYFPVIIAMFLSLTIIRLNAVRQKQRFGVTFRKNMSVIILTCVVAYFSSQPVLTKYYDATSTKQNTLTPASQEIISQVKGGLTISSYVNVLDPRFWSFMYPGFIMANRDQFRQYSRFKPEIELKVIYYYAETPNAKLEQEYPGLDAWGRARKVCEMYDIDSTMLKNKEEIDSLVDLTREGYTFIRQLVRDNGQKEWLRIYDYGGGFPSEGEISVAFKRMVMELPKIGFVTGHRERDLYGDNAQDYSFVYSNKKCRVALCNQGFDVEEIMLDRQIPHDINIVVFADMRSELSQREETVLREYIARGGNLFILGEPRHRDAQNLFLRKHFGLELTPLVVGYDKTFGSEIMPNVLACRPTREGVEKIYHLGDIYAVAMDGCSGIEQVEDKGYQLHTIVECDSNGRYWTELETTDFVDDSIRFNPAIGEKMDTFKTVVGLTRQVEGKEQRILVSGDADCFSNNEFMIHRRISANNAMLLLGGCYWLSEGKAPLDMRRPRLTDNKVYLGVSGYKVLRWSLLGFFPLSLLGLGIYIWIRRRGR